MSLSFRLPAPASKIVITQPEIAKVTATSDSSFYIQGIEFGATNMLIYDRGGALSEVVNVRIGYDAEGLQQDEGVEAVGQAQVLHHDVLRHHVRLPRDGDRGDVGEEQHVAAREADLREAVRLALSGKSAVMPVIKRTSDAPYRWKIDSAPLSRIANKEKTVPRRYITRDGFGITAKAREYFAPLIQGEDYPKYKDGVPVYATLKNVAVPRKLPAFELK